MTEVNFLEKIISTLIPIDVFYSYDGPKFYSCRDKVGQKFLVYWVDENEFGNIWMYSRVSNERLMALKKGFISVKDALAQPEEGFIFLVASKIDGFNISQVMASDIPLDWLPLADEYLKIDAQTLPDKDLSAIELANRSKREVLDISLIKGSNSYEISCSNLGHILNATQNVVNSLMYPLESSVKKIPEFVRHKAELSVTALFAGSFGIRLQTKGSDLVSGGDVSNALEGLGKLLEKLIRLIL